MSGSLDRLAVVSDGIDSVLDDLIESMTARLQAGEAVDVEEWVRRYPEHAERLRRLVPALVMMADLGESSPRELEGTAAGGPVGGGGVLGDFRITREIGRGGMGVVYEAEQVSLGRRVALKVLPLAAALDGKQLQRFQLEAHAAACLHHTNIVPVHAVGCERGVPFYAMQYIEGRSLAQLIAELRRLEGFDASYLSPANLADLSTATLAADLASGRLTGGTGGPADRDTTGSPGGRRDELEPAMPASGPAPGTPAPRPGGESPSDSSTRSRAYLRNVAQLGVQVAEALDHAHTRGILHRDIKPANLLLDMQGQLWVADFGLAQIQGHPGLTMTGDVLGTLRYMSPEQALARRVVIDGRTDIYSLGVTLYELVTLRPAVEGQDRQEILRKIAEAEPVPPRRLNPAVPRDLETILLKAMAKEPGGRYAMAKDLADELRRFLDDKPIQARRPSLLDRATKWTRRHRAAVWSAGISLAVLLVMAVAGLATSTVLIARERNQKDAALKQRETALAIAEANLGLARKAVDELYTELREEMSDLPQMQSLERKLLHKALNFYLVFAQQKSTDPEIRRGTGQAYRRVGQIQHKLNQHQQAEQALILAVARFEELVAEYPSEPQYRLDLASAYQALGLVLAETKGGLQAEQAHRRAIQLLDQLVAKYPERADCRWNLAAAQNSLGTQIHARPQEAERAHREAIRLCERLVAGFPERSQYWGELVRGHYTLGLVRARTGRSQQAEKPFRDAIVLFRQQAGLLNTSYYRRLLPMADLELAKVLHALGRIPDARDAYQEAIGLLEQYVTNFPRVSEYWSRLYDGYADLVRLLEQGGHSQEAASICRQALGLYEGLAGRLPDEGTDPEVLRIATGLDAVLKNSGRLHEREWGYRRALEVLERLAAQCPTVPGYQFHAAYWHNALGTLLMATGRAPQAANAYRHVVEESMALSAGHPEMKQLAGFSMVFLAIAYWQLGERDQARQWYDRAVLWRERNKPNDDELRRFHAEAAALLGLPEPAPPTKKEMPRPAKG